jgi:FkbM family methyltransferase
MKKTFRSFLNKLGVDLHKYPPDRNLVIHRRGLIKTLEIDCVWDFGASDGKYGVEIRSDGYRGQIVSCEPLQESFAKLQDAAEGDINWRLFQGAVGSEPKEVELVLSGNLDSSSLLQIKQRHVDAYPSSSMTGRQVTKVATWDQLAKEFQIPRGNWMAKVDVQGFEMEVFKGGAEAFEFLKLIEIELSLEELYTGQPLFQEMHQFFARNGFYLYWMEPGFVDHSKHEILQVECLYLRDKGL